MKRDARRRRHTTALDMAGLKENLHHWCLMGTVSLTLPLPTSICGGEHDDKRLSDEGVCPTGLTAIVTGVAFNHRHHLLPGKRRQVLTISFLPW